MKAIERRIEKLDQQIAQLPCTKPGHDTMFLFWIGEEPSAENEALFKAIRECKNCQNQDKLRVSFMKFGKVTESEPASRGPVPIDGTPSPWLRDFKPERDDRPSISLDRKPEPQPKIASQVPEQPAHVRIAQWLKEKEF